MIWAVIPIKRVELSLQRLSPVLRASERRRLMTAMLDDVISSLLGVGTLDEVAVVATPGPLVELAASRGVRWIPERANRGHSIAIAEAAAQLAVDGIRTMLTVTADVPLVEPDELDLALTQHAAAPALTVVPSRSGMGSNCLICSPPDVIPFSFGDGSLARHLAAARAAGATTRVLQLRGIGLDIDTPHDLGALLTRERNTRSERLLDSLSLHARLAEYAAR